jgi:hypothetical protein
MRDRNKRDIAIGRFAGFFSNLLRPQDEDQLSQYHDIFKLLQEACGQDLSQFKVAPDRVNAAAANATTASSGGRWQIRHPKKSFVEFAYFRGQAQGLIDYLKVNQGSRPG